MADDECNYIHVMMITDLYFFNVITYVFLIIALYRFFKYKSVGIFSRRSLKWSNSFGVKIFFSIHISAIYSSLPIIFFPLFGKFALIYLINSITWIILCCLLYFEYRRQIPQTWIGIRGFWTLNGIFYYVRIIYFLILENRHDNQNIFSFFILMILKSVLSSFLLFLALFYPKDSIARFETIPERQASNEEIGYDESNQYNKLSAQKENSIPLYIDSFYILEKEHRNIKLQPFKFLDLDIRGNNYHYSYQFKLKISKFKNRKFSSFKNEILKKSSDVKFSIQLIIPIISPNLETIRYNSSNYNIKKNFNELMEINSKLIKIFRQAFNYNDYHVTKLESINLIENNEDTINKLLSNVEVLYTILSCKYFYFLTSFMKILNIENLALNEFYEILKSRNNISIVREEEDRRNSSLRQSPHNFSLSKNENEFESLNDLCKTFRFINSIITNSRNMVIIKIRRINDLGLNTTIFYSIIYENKTVTSSEFKVKKFIDIVNQFENTQKIVNLKNFLDHLINPTFENSQNYNYKNNLILESLIEDILNDLFYMKQDIFSFFNLNKICKLGSGQISMSTVFNYFELLQSKKLKKMGFVQDEDNILNYKLKISSFKIDECSIKKKIEDNKIKGFEMSLSLCSIFHSQQNEQIRKSELRIKLVDLKNILLDIHKISSKQKYDKIKEQNINLIKLIEDIHSTFSHIEDKKISFLVNSLITQLENLTNTPSSYLFYSNSFRQIFFIDNLLHHTYDESFLLTENITISPSHKNINFYNKEDSEISVVKQQSLSNNSFINNILKESIP